MIALALLVVCGLFFVLQLYYYLRIVGAVAWSKPNEEPVKRIGVSVIVCAKNEAENLRKLVPLLAQQDYPQFELVLIDDASSDDTLEVMEGFEKQYANIRLVKVENNEAFWGSKKFALTLGIKAAKYEYLLFTDADCEPASDQWIAAMTRHFTPQKTLVLGYGAYQKAGGSLLNKMLRWDTLLSAALYMGSAQVRRPYMGVGRNLAYKRELFFKVRGFMDHMKVRSGDDDLFINQAATRSNTSICMDPDGTTLSIPPSTWGGWMRQKRRHFTTFKHYAPSNRWFLIGFSLSQWLFLASAIALLFDPLYWIPAVVVLVLRYVLVWWSLGKTALRLREKDLVYILPFWELLWMFLQWRLAWQVAFTQPDTWR